MNGAFPKAEFLPGQDHSLGPVKKNSLATISVEYRFFPSFL